jgi:hypothetical protein
MEPVEDEPTPLDCTVPAIVAPVAEGAAPGIVVSGAVGDAEPPHAVASAANIPAEHSRTRERIVAVTIVKPLSPGCPGLAPGRSGRLRPVFSGGAGRDRRSPR